MFESKEKKAEMAAEKQAEKDRSLNWEEIASSGWLAEMTRRAKVPGGWLIAIMIHASQEKPPGVTFLPDPEHKWDAKLA